jgi:hypothetical protein
MPFLQAALLLNDRDMVYDIAPQIKKSPFLALQACKSFTDLPGLDDSTKRFVQTVFCSGNE